MSEKNLNAISDKEIDDLLNEPTNGEASDDTIPELSESTNEEIVGLPTVDFNIGSLKSNIEKYYLSGAINRALFTNKDGKLKIIGIEDNKSLYAIINSRGTIIESDVQFGIYNTSNMLGLLNLLEGNVAVEFGSHNIVLSQPDVDIEINFADESVIGPDSYKAPNPTKLPKDYQIDMTLNREFIDRILKSIGAFSSSEKNLYFTFKRHKAKLVIGDDASKSNKVNFDISEMGTFTEFKGQVAFFLKFFKSILSSIKDMDKITLKVSTEGIMVIECTDENSMCTYFMGADNENTTIK